jgi:hypothetical protein
MRRRQRRRAISFGFSLIFRFFIRRQRRHYIFIDCFHDVSDAAADFSQIFSRHSPISQVSEPSRYFHDFRRLIAAE